MSSLVAATPRLPTPASPRPRRLGVVAVALSALDRAEFLPAEVEAQLPEVAERVELLDPALMGSPEAWSELLSNSGAEALISGWSTPRLPEKPPAALRYVCHLTGSVRGVVSRAQIERGLLVTNWGGSIARVVAEGTLMHILAATRRVGHWGPAMHRDRAWKNRSTETASLFGRRVGLHGFGQVARELTRLLEPFGVRVSVHAPDAAAAAAAGWRIQPVDTLEALFADNDVVVELAPLNPRTEGIVTERHLRLLRPGAIFVNTARGRLVDEAALVKVAREGRVFIGLDVFAVEPLPPEHPLRGLPNVLLTPHISGPTTDRRRDAGLHALRNLRAFASEAPLEAVVTPEVYDLST